jgi:energy-coupling factor transporter ATP-binding protein EcfA2
MKPCRPIIVVEGPDGSGKSTLAASLSKILNWPMIHTGGPIFEKKTFESQIVGLKETEHVIYDRIPPISQLVYPLIFGRDAYTSLSETLELLNVMNPWILYCKTKHPNMVSTPKAHKSPEWTQSVLDKHEAICTQYDIIMSLLPNVIVYDWQKPDRWEMFLCVD